MTRNALYPDVKTSHFVRRRRRGFTLLELLIVIGIISVLASLLLPTVGRIRETAKAVHCQNNVRSLMQGVLAFAVDNDNRLVGNTSDTGNPVPSERDFLFGNIVGSASTLTSAPQSGTLFPYVGGIYDAYLCPTVQALTGAGGSDSTNGRFDYAIFGVWAGAPIGKIAPTSRMYWPDGHFDTLPTPIVVQEDPSTVNASNMEGGHNNHDAMSHIHSGGSYYGAIDGSVQFVNESPGIPLSMIPAGKPGTGAWVWQSLAPSGQFGSMASGGNWGFWEHQ